MSITEGWHKSSHSGCNGNCVEVWAKSSYCSQGNCLEWRFQKSSHSYLEAMCLEAAYRKSSHLSTVNCAEVALQDGTVLVRDSKDPDGPKVTFSAGQWRKFLARVKAT